MSRLPALSSATGTSPHLGRKGRRAACVGQRRGNGGLPRRGGICCVLAHSTPDRCNAVYSQAYTWRKNAEPLWQNTRSRVAV